MVEGAADGVYCDCCGLVPFECTGNGACTAKRNGKKKSINQQVTQANVDAHVKGKNTTLHEAIRLVTAADGNNGTFFNKVSNKEFINKGNISWLGGVKPPPHLRRIVRANRAKGSYVVVGGSNHYSNPKLKTLPTGQNIRYARPVPIGSRAWCVPPMQRMGPALWSAVGAPSRACIQVCHWEFVVTLIQVWGGSHVG